MSWTKRVQHPSEVLRKSDDVQVVVLGVDPENKRISLGLKQTQDDPWDSLAGQYGAGVEKTGSVVRLLEDGVVVDLGDDVEGFIPRTQLEVPENELVENYIREGLSLEFAGDRVRRRKPPDRADPDAGAGASAGRAAETGGLE